MKFREKLKEMMKNEEGFSLVELIIVIFLILIVVILAFVSHGTILKYIVGGIAGIIVIAIIIAFISNLRK